MSKNVYVPATAIRDMSECFYDHQEYADFMTELRDTCLRIVDLSTDDEGYFFVEDSGEAEILCRSAKFFQNNIELINQIAQAYYDKKWKK
jgi:mannitol-1-phosphate/altronate dehydrogenase